MIDISSSITANGPSQRMMKEGRRAPGIWYVDHDGHGSTDPAVAFTEPKARCCRWAASMPPQGASASG